jgi:TonB family protein
MLRPSPTRQAHSAPTGPARRDKQRGKLLIAAVLLLAAIITVLIRNHGSSEDNDQAAVAESEPTQSAPSNAAETPATPAAETSNPAAPVESTPVHSAIATRKLSRNPHQTIHLASGSANPESKAQADSATWGPATLAAGRVETSSTLPAEQTVQPQYPVLARQMAVQGSVLLQALIGADGVVQDLRVISGPAILVSAARQAVQQWRFKPYLVAGKPVETQARVTVNFTINVSNTQARYHIDSVTTSGAL